MLSVSEIMTDLFPLIAALSTMMISQTIKIAYLFFVKKQFALKNLFLSGGMPSSHSGLVTAVSTGIGITNGWTSSVFIISVVFSLVVIYDAAGVRQAVGEQAILLNQMMKQLNSDRKKPFNESLGHTPSEIAVGIVFGIGTTLLVYRLLSGNLLTS